MADDFHKKVIDELLKKIEVEIKSPLTLSYLAKYCGYSVGHLPRMFKSEMGVTLGVYIRRRKLYFISLELLSNDVKIIDAAIDYGFSSQQSLTRAFKFMYGVTPYEFKKAEREGGK